MFHPVPRTEPSDRWAVIVVVSLVFGGILLTVLLAKFVG
jgi:hypothetical protein